MKNLVRQQAPAGGQPDSCSLGEQEAVSGQALRNFERREDPLAPKLVFESCRVHSLIQAQAQEPCFFMLPVGREPRGFGGFGGAEISFQVVRGFRAKNKTVVALQRRRSIQSQAKVGTAFPVAQVVTGLKPGTREIGDLVLLEARLRELLDGRFIHASNRVVGWNQAGMVTRAALEHLPAQARILVHLEHIDAGVRDSAVDQYVKRFLPRCKGLAGQASNQIDVEVLDSGLAEAPQVLLHGSPTVQAAGFARFLVNERLDAEADPVRA